MCLQMSNTSDQLELHPSPTLQEEEERWIREQHEKQAYTRLWVHQARRTTERGLLENPNRSSRPAPKRENPQYEQDRRWKKKLTGLSPPPRPGARARPGLVVEHEPPNKKQKAEKRPAKPATSAVALVANEAVAPRNQPGPDIDLELPWVVHPIKDTGFRRVTLAVSLPVSKFPVPPGVEEEPAGEAEVDEIDDTLIPEIQSPERYEASTTEMYNFRAHLKPAAFAILKEKDCSEWRAFCNNGKIAIKTEYGVPKASHFTPRAPDKTKKDHRPHPMHCRICGIKFRPRNRGQVEDSSDEEWPPNKLRSVVVKVEPQNSHYIPGDELKKGRGRRLLPSHQPRHQNEVLQCRLERP